MQDDGKYIDESIQGQATIVEGGSGKGKKLLLESYGCAMNFADSEVVASILTKEGYETTNEASEADVIFLNTCAIRDNAEVRVRKRITDFKRLKKENPKLIIGVLGCMAERVREKLLDEEKLIDIVAGPDAYRDIPNLLQEVETGQKAINVLLSREETYADIAPVKLNSNGVTAFVSIMRGCDNMCTFCVVPFTRGRERSRDPESIIKEATDLFNQGYREVTLLGQNVDSYRWNISKKGEILEKGKPVVNFANLLEMVAKIGPELRVRFSTSHPKDMNNEVLYAIARHNNICKNIHLPVQSGNSELLKRMNRGYTREWYLERVDAIRRIIPNCAITTDIITGFCGETDEMHQETLTLMKEVEFNSAYMYKYSERPKTLAERKYEDDVPEETKQKRLQDIIELKMAHSHKIHKTMIGAEQEVLIEGVSKKSEDEYYGKNSQFITVILPKGNYKIGDYAQVKITSCSTATLRGELI